MNVHVTKPSPTVTIELSLREAHDLRRLLEYTVGQRAGGYQLLYDLNEKLGAD